MKHRIKRLIWIALGIIAVLVVIHSVSPTLGMQAPFNQWVWKHYPVQKIRYYMSDSLIEKLNNFAQYIDNQAKIEI